MAVSAVLPIPGTVPRLPMQGKDIAMMNAGLDIVGFGGYLLTATLLF